jgi:2-methylcitrate dehydratase PrpD
MEGIGAAAPPLRLKVSAKKISITERIAKYVATRRFTDIPAAVRDTAKRHVLDGIATMIAGAGEDASVHIRRYTMGSRRQPERRSRDARQNRGAYAALANAVPGPRVRL